MAVGEEFGYNKRRVAQRKELMKEGTLSRTFLIIFALAACAAASCACGGVPKYADELRDHCWLWGHETGQVDGANKSVCFTFFRMPALRTASPI